MRLDEHGRWVSDDGAYVWDEPAQTWQLVGSAPSPSAASGSPAGGTGAPGAVGSASARVPAATTGPATTGPVPTGPAATPTATSASASAERTGSFEPTTYPDGGATGSWELAGAQGRDAALDAAATGEFSRPAPGPAATGPMPLRAAGPTAPAATPVRTAGQSRNPVGPPRRDPDAGTGAFPVPVGAGDTRAPADITDGIPRRTAQSWQPRPATRFTPVGTGVDDDADDRRPDTGGTRGPDRGGVGAVLRRPPVLAGLTALVLLLALGVAGFVVLGGDDAEPTASAPAATEGRYEASIRQNYIDACLGHSDGNQRYCTCTLEKLEADYTQEQYLDFNSDVESDNSQRIVREIYAACRNLR